MLPIFLMTQLVVIPLLVAWLVTYRSDSPLFFQRVRDVAITLTWIGFALSTDPYLQAIFWSVSAILLLLPVTSLEGRVRKPEMLWHAASVACFVAGAFLPLALRPAFFLAAFAVRFGIFPLHGIITHADEARVDVRLFSNLHLPLVLPFVATRLSAQFGADEATRTLGALFFAAGGLYLALLLLTETKLPRFQAQLGAWQLCLVMTLAFANFREPMFHLLFFTLSATLPFGALLIAYRLMAQRVRIESFEDRPVLNQLIPGLAAPFLVLSLAVVFSPFTVSFIAEEISLGELFTHSFSAGVAVLLSTVLVASRLYLVYTRLFLGRYAWSRTPLQLQTRDRWLLFVLLLLIVLPGVFPRLGIDAVDQGVEQAAGEHAEIKG